MNTPETQRPTRPRFCSDEAIQEMYNIIDDLALYAKDRDSTTVHITVKEAIAIVESALAQLDRYTKRLHAKQTSQNHDLTLVRADLAEAEKKLITLAWISLALWVAAALTILILLLI